MNIIKIILKLLFLQILFALEVFALNVNISKNKILVSANYKEDIITVFGKKEDTGKIAIILKSEKVDYKVYNKQKIFGIWQNSNPRIFKGIYNLYKLQTEENMKINRKDLFRELELGILNVNFYNFTGAKEALKTAEYKEAFLKHKEKTKNYEEEHGKISVFENSDLFITEIKIPSDIKQGTYLLQVFLIEEEKIKEISIFKIFVEHEGFIKTLKMLSVKNKLLYGIISILLSVSIAFLSFWVTKIIYYNRAQ